jgi:aminopeptidase N
VSQPYRSLQHTEAVERRALLDLTAYDVVLDLSIDDATFRSVTTIDLTSAGGATFLDIRPVRLHSIALDGSALDVDLLEGGRFPLALSPGAHRIQVEATMPFRNDGEGLHRTIDPADGQPYIYGMSFMEAAPTIFACFDQPDLKAPYTFHVTAPPDWTVIGNAPGAQVSRGPDRAEWEFEQTQPLSTYFVTLVAGPWHVIRSEHDGIPLSLSARASIAPHLDKDADELFTITAQCFDEFHRLFGIRYPFGNYHQAFVPEFNAGAMENPGCVTFRDPLVFTSKVTRGQRIQRAVTVAHEMAHQWFGNLTTPVWWDDLWLNESFAEYMGNRVTADVTEYDDAWTHNAFVRRQWGLIADQRPSTHPVASNGAVSAAAALQDFDGISYNKGAGIVRQLNTLLGDEAFFAGAIDHFTRFRFGNATMADLVGSWERAGAVDLTAYVQNWLRTSGPDTLLLDRGAGALLRTPPPRRDDEAAPDRAHVLHLATARPGEPWCLAEVTIDSPRLEWNAGPGEAVLIDPYEDTWAATWPDPETVGLLPQLVDTDDDRLRSGIWNNVRTGFHNAAVSPAAVLDLLDAAVPIEASDDALSTLLPWALTKVGPLSGNPTAALARINSSCLARLATAEPGSSVQLAAFRGAAGSTTASGALETWLAGDDLPDGLALDPDLRWLLLVQLAALGHLDETALQDELAMAPTTKAQVEFARAMASRPTAEAKGWAWQRFTGAVPASNYELEAIGAGFWRPGQTHLTEEYVERYFAALPGLSAVHEGWVLGQVASAFFPMTSLTQSTVDQASAALAQTDLDPTIRRRLVDDTDELRRRLAVVAAYPS